VKSSSVRKLRTRSWHKFQDITVSHGETIHRIANKLTERNITGGGI